MKRVNFMITDKQHKELKKESRKTGLSVSEINRRAIDEYLEKKRQQK